MTQKQTTLRYNRVPFHTDGGEDILQRVEKHWEQMRSNGPVPSRMAFSPEPLDQALSHCFVLERVAPHLARFRVAGKALTEILGTEARSMPLSALFTAAGRQALEPLIAAVCDGPEIVELPLTAGRGLARGMLRARLLMMPLTDRDGEVTRIFGAIVVDHRPGRKALRFDVDLSLPVRRKAIPPMRAAIQRMKAELDVMEAAKPRSTASLLPLRPVAGRPHLRLVVDNT